MDLTACVESARQLAHGTEPDRQSSVAVLVKAADDVWLCVTCFTQIQQGNHLMA